MAIKHSKTNRGFALVNFDDCYGQKCSLQQSSLAKYVQPGTSAVWLGVDDADPKVMASQAALVGVKTEETTGWVPYPIPPQVSLSTRMHLSRNNAKQIIKLLSRWLETGEFKPGKNPARGKVR